MPRSAARDVYARSSLRKSYVDLCIDFVDERDLSPLFSVGGRWSLRGKCWSLDEPRQSLQVKLHPGQLDSAEFMGAWFKSHITGVPMRTGPAFSVLWLGGTRSGKTFFGDHMALAYGVAKPKSKVWIIGENKDDALDEIEAELDSIIPSAWANKVAKSYKLVNGTTIFLKSGKYPAKLKRGRCSYSFINEGQNVPRGSYDILRMRSADDGGLVTVAANPPNMNPAGEWISEWATEHKAGRRDGQKVFHYHPKDNPHISQEHLESLKDETDPRTYEIEVLGKVLPAVNAVYHAFSPVDNIDTPPELPGLDVTAEFARRAGLGKGISHLVGMDFQRTPHMAAVVAKAFENPRDPDRPLIYYVDEIVVDLGDEHDLSDALFDIGLNTRTTALVGDASGETQDVDRNVNGSSFRIFREAGWRIHFPDRREKRNPRIQNRMKNDNRLFLSTSGQRLVMIDLDCVELREAVQKWRKKGGFPDRRSKYAHICDAMSYLNWRLYPRKIQKGASERGYKSISKRKRRNQLKDW